MKRLEALQFSHQLLARYRNHTGQRGHYRRVGGGYVGHGTYLMGDVLELRTTEDLPSRETLKRCNLAEWIEWLKYPSHPHLLRPQVIMLLEGG
jgi:hypothetical protein